MSHANSMNWFFQNTSHFKKLNCFTIEFYPRKIKWCAAQHIKILMSVAYPNKNTLIYSR